MSAPRFPLATVTGFPRIGPRRELKRALESFWAGTITAEALEQAAHTLRVSTYETVNDLGLGEDYAIPADFSYYDQVLDAAFTTGVIPSTPGNELAEYFEAARGATARDMTKWFDTNYHYLVPEIADDQEFAAHPERLVKLFAEAKAAGHLVRPVLVGPVTLLALSKAAAGATKAPLDRLEELTTVYVELLAAFKAAGIDWIQLDEPALVADFDFATDAELAELAARTYKRLLTESARPQVFLATPYGSLRAGLDAVALVKPEALGVDVSAATRTLDPEYVSRLAAADLSETRLVAGVIDGRNIWIADLEKELGVLTELGAASVSTSTSLLHVPYTVSVETRLPVDVAGWLSFAHEKVGEVATLAAAVRNGGPDDAAFAKSARAHRTRAESISVTDAEVQERLRVERPVRRPDAEVRRTAQQVLDIPTLPTTTIGSFPQTSEVRKARADVRNGVITEDEYTAVMKEEIAKVVQLQTDLGLDVIVHGEPERNDMVQYFAENLDGFATTELGWVQSYGSRCTRPPILFGDVSRPAPITTEWSTYTASLTSKPVKGMLTGPVTILAWSFVRDDQPLSVSGRQIALALADEVLDLEKAGISIIQIDEPALRELLPLRREHRAAYLDWSVDAFRQVSVEVADRTQIHTHLCYSEFNQVLDAIDALDADVTSIEAARSRMEILSALDGHEFSRGIGPGVYDIHSPYVPSVEEITELIEKALQHVSLEKLWINPDCGLKTRGYAEVEASLANLVEARKAVEAKLAVRV